MMTERSQEMTETKNAVTRDELAMKLDKAYHDVRELEDALAHYDDDVEVEQEKSELDMVADEVTDIYNSFIFRGFTEEQALKLTCSLLQ